MHNRGAAMYCLRQCSLGRPQLHVELQSESKWLAHSDYACKGPTGAVKVVRKVQYELRGAPQLF